MMSYILIIGAKSDIAKELAKIYAKNGYDLYLANTNIIELANLARHIKIAYDKNANLIEFDITNFNSHSSFYHSLNPKPLGVIILSGYMCEQKECENDFNKTLNTINVNFTGAVSLLNIVANDMQISKKGFIVGVSSVAGDRGRATNYIYGSSKAAFSEYLSGLRNKLTSFNINVLTIKPGFVDTKMTKGLKLPKKLTATPYEVAFDIFNAQQKKKDIIYTKKIWYFIMLIIKNIPERIFKKLKI